MSIFTRYSLLATRYSRRAGYTLIELLIVFSITALISSFAIVYSRNAAKQVALYVEAQKIAEIIFRAKAIATSAHYESALTCGYGVMIDYTTATYQIFSYDPPNSNPRDPQCNTIATTGISTGNVNFSSAISRANSFNLNPDLAFSQNIDSLVYVLFVAPYPTTVISDSTSGATAPPPGIGKVYLHTIIGGGDIVVTVSTGGQISF